MANEVRLNFLNDVQGMEELVRLVNRVDALEKSMDRYKNAATRAAGSVNRTTQAMNQQGKAARSAQLGTQQLGLQINDLATSISTGANPMYAMNQQLGQIGYAMSQMQGRARSLGMFLAGTWGAAIGLAAMGLYTLWQNTNQAKTGMEAFREELMKTETTADLLSEALATVGDRMKMTLQDSVVLLQMTLNNTEAQITQLESQQRTAAKLGTSGISAGDGRTSAQRSAINKRINSELEDLTWTAIELQGKIDRANSSIAKMSEKKDKAAKSSRSMKGATKDLTKELEKQREEFQNAQNTFLRISMGMEPFTSEVQKQAREITELTESFRKLWQTAEGREFVENRGGFEAMQERLKELRKPLFMAEEEMRNGLKLDFEEIDPQTVVDQMKPAMERATDMIRGYTDEMKRSFESVGNAVSSAFMGMISGAQSWRDGLRGIIQEVIAQLWRLYVVQQITGFVTGLLGGIGLPTSSSSASVASLGGGGLGFRAQGGPVAAGKPYIVGEKGPELMIPGRSGSVVPNDKMGMGGGTVIQVDARGSNDPEMVRQQVQRGIIEAAPQIIAASEARTIRTLKRPRLAGGSY